VGDNGSIEGAHILVVDDEPGIVDVLTFALEEAGFSTSVATDGPSALRLALTTNPALVLLDVMLPGIDGLEVCRQVRAASNVPIIIVSAKGSEADRIAGLELYADDYVVKPFSLGEIMARIKTVLHRTTTASGIDAASGRGTAADRIAVRGRLVLDTATFTATWSGTAIDLTRIQFDLLDALSRRPDIVFTRAQLLSEVWGQSFVDDVRTVDSMVKRLRRKLEDAGAPTELIESRRERGYLARRDVLHGDDR
jgi:two-component system, OmpR family, response regulator VicR